MFLGILVRYRYLLLILITYLVLGIAYSVAIPLGETPDESEHFLYLQHIALRRKLPVMSPVTDENVTLEAHQPPLLYVVGAALTGWSEMDTADNLEANPCFSYEPDDPGRKHVFLHRSEEWPPQRGVFVSFQLMRWFSVLLGAGTVYLAFKIGSQVYPQDDRLGLAAAAALAFNPQFIFVTGSLNNDVPTAFFGAAIVALCVTAVQQRRKHHFLALGVLVGLGMLTKFSLLALWPLAILAAGLSGFNRQAPNLTAGQPSEKYRRIRFLNAEFHLRSLILNLLSVLILPVFIAGWWYWRAYNLYGDPLMWEVSLLAKGPVIARNSPFVASDLLKFVEIHFQSYWLWFGWLNVKAPTWIYGLLVVGVVAAGIGLLRLSLKRHYPINLTALGFNVLAIFAIYASLMQYVQTINWTGYQGRLAFATAASIAVMLSLGWMSIGGRRLAKIVIGGLLVMAVAALPLIIMPAYPRPEIYQPSTGLARTCARFASGLQIEAVEMAEKTQPGQSLRATVYGYGLTSAAEPQQLLARLIGRNSSVVGMTAQSINWRAGDVVSKTLSVPVNSGAQPARAVLEIGMLTPSGEWQAATSATGRLLEVPLGVRNVKISPKRPVLATPQQTAEASFGGELALQGYDLAHEGEQAVVTLYWQALKPIPHDYTTFVHLLDGDGRLVAQADSQPHDGAYPTSIWDAGESVVDVKTVRLPEDSGQQPYQMAVGVYLLETLERLPVSSSGPNVLMGDRFLLAPFTASNSVPQHGG